MECCAQCKTGACDTECRDCAAPICGNRCFKMHAQIGCGVATLSMDARHETVANTWFRKIASTTDQQQTVLMYLSPGEATENEVHPNATQTVRVERGTGYLISGRSITILQPGVEAVVRPGAEHLISADLPGTGEGQGDGAGKGLWIRSIYSPPQYTRDLERNPIQVRGDMPVAIGEGVDDVLERIQRMRPRDRYSFIAALPDEARHDVFMQMEPTRSMTAWEIDGLMNALPMKKWRYHIDRLGGAGGMAYLNLVPPEHWLSSTSPSRVKRYIYLRDFVHWKDRVRYLLDPVRERFFNEYERMIEDRFDDDESRRLEGAYFTQQRAARKSFPESLAYMKQMKSDADRQEYFYAMPNTARRQLLMWIAEEYKYYPTIYDLLDAMPRIMWAYHMDKMSMAQRMAYLDAAPPETWELGSRPRAQEMRVALLEGRWLDTYHMARGRETTRRGGRTLTSKKEWYLLKVDGRRERYWEYVRETSAARAEEEAEWEADRREAQLLNERWKKLRPLFMPTGSSYVNWADSSLTAEEAKVLRRISGKGTREKLRKERVGLVNNFA